MSLNKNQYYHTFYTVNSTNPTHLIETTYDNTGTLISTLDLSFGIGRNVVDILGLLDTNSNQPYTLGIVDTSNTAVCTDLAYFNVYSKALNTTQKTKLMSYVNNTFKEPRTAVTNIYTVTVAGGKYWISTNGGPSVQQPSIFFSSGNQYIFDQSDTSNTGNTLVLGTTNDSLSNVVGNNVVYNGTAGSANAYTLIDFSGANAATPLLFYYSSTMSGMGSTNTFIIYVVTISGGVYYMATGGGDSIQLPSIAFQTTGTYVFDQSSLSNSGNTLVLGTVNEITNSVVGNNVVYSGTAGTTNAYTLIDFTGANPAPTSLYYFSASRFGLTTTRPYTYYTVTVSGGVFYFSNQSQPYIQFSSGNLYVFDQSHSTNSGNTLVLGTLTDISSTIISTTNAVYNGTPGSTKAYTSIDFSGAATTTMYYFSRTTAGMGTPTTTYVVTVSGGTFWLTNAGTTAQQPVITFSPNRVYIFDQTGNTNLGNTLVLGTKQEGMGSSVTNNVITYETAGTSGAYTVIDFGLPNPASNPIYYYSSSTVGLGTATIKYVVTVSGGVYYLADGGTNVAQRNVSFTSSNLYLFDQSDGSNTGNTLVLGTVPEIGNTKILANVVYNGTPGSAGAYTLIKVDTTPLYYFSVSNVGLGTTPTKYIVTVSGNAYYLSGLTGPRPPVTFTSGNLYLFDQSDGSNGGNTLVLGTTVDLSSSIVNTNVTYNGTAGASGAYTLIRADTASLYYFSRTTAGMGYLPKITLVSTTGTGIEESNSSFSWVKVTSNCNVTINIPTGKILYYVIVGGGGGGATQYLGTANNQATGGGGGACIDGSYTTSGNSTFVIAIGAGGTVVPYNIGGGNANNGYNTLITSPISKTAFSGAGGGGSTNEYGFAGSNSSITLSYCVINTNNTKGKAKAINQSGAGLTVTLGTTIFYFGTGGGGGGGSNAGGTIYGSGYGNGAFDRNGYSALANSGGGGGGFAGVGGSGFTGGLGGSGCVLFFWQK